ncbi:hypothetical protein [Nocardia sp. NPDC057030]|uniref:hypothetical protein n=1 Tax=unclassified Nocardia TaxID=2637762 RepID=UPI0036370815
MIAGRYLLVAQTPMDRLGTRALLFGLVCDMMRNASVQHAITRVCWMFDDAYVINVVRQVSFGPLLLSIMCIYGMPGSPPLPTTTGQSWLVASDATMPWQSPPPR